ncbi:hypothetical protein [Cereibacter azotoformans]|uniref:Uncharacterized protein n=1 Tax=Cereibacter azotoformans TaxID=43057 RepID=A0A2T5JN57_9RHOB|nr:hypothetical protein [Cereibacter azotoformans]MBO4169557.1 hypothetical protein [Cereibacter azotoformans]PTR08716.1 hypothetical protein C8J28_1343 [Cereibacter azotoformans]
MSVGQVFFAWVADGEAFDAGVHAREDEDVFRLTISESEGEFAVATIEIRNPRAGLLSPARRQRCFISAELDGVVALLFSGRVVGPPAGLGRETIEIEVIGRPDDWQAVQAAFVEQLKLDPRYHPALVAEEDRSDLTAVLEGYSALPRWDRVTGELSLAALTNEGTQPVIDMTDHVMDDSLDVTFGGSPVTTVVVELDLTWEQVCPVMSKPYSAPPGRQASGVIAQALDGGRCSTMTPDAYQSSWPAAGASLDGGWSVIGSYLRRTTSSIPYTRMISVTEAAPSDVSYAGSEYAIQFPIVAFDGELLLGGVYRQPRREIVRIAVSSDIQPVSLDTSTEVLSLSAAGEDISASTPFSITGSYGVLDDETGEVVQRSVTSSVTRGTLAHPRLAIQSEAEPLIVAAVARAEARLRTAARCVDVEVEVPLEIGATLTSASVVRVVDDRIPGGSVTGKVTSVELEISDTTIARISFAASVGRSTVASGAAAEVQGYAEPYEPPVVTNCRLFGTGSGQWLFDDLRVRNQAPAQRTVADGVSVTAEISRYADLGYTWAQRVDDQAAVTAIGEALADVPTELVATLRRLDAVDETVTDVECIMSAPVQIVRDIDLEA